MYNPRYRQIATAVWGLRFHQPLRVLITLLVGYECKDKALEFVLRERCPVERRGDLPSLLLAYYLPQIVGIDRYRLVLSIEIFFQSGLYRGPIVCPNIPEIPGQGKANVLS